MIVNAIQARGLLRQLLRIARQMPTLERYTVARQRILNEYRLNQRLTDPAAITEALTLAEVQRDNLMIQLKHLTDLHRNDVLGSLPLVVPVNVYKSRSRNDGNPLEVQHQEKERKALREHVRRKLMQMKP